MFHLPVFRLPCLISCARLFTRLLLFDGGGDLNPFGPPSNFNTIRLPMQLHPVETRVQYKYTVQGARGTEAIPNIDFWRTVKMHIADGVRYTTSCGKGTRTKNYENI